MLDFLDAALEHASVKRAPAGEKAEEPVDQKVLLDRMCQAFVDKCAARSVELRRDAEEQEQTLNILSEELSGDAEPPDDWQPGSPTQHEDHVVEESEDEESEGEGGENLDATEVLARVLNQPKWRL
uniref:Uncharacterized protein n=1 Tax=Strombidinopsis acuminata TaxID=141414 RepID=A0A7S3S6T3_9SPIT|eukprot:scaffold235520_cov36-Tisochrysis_lutea.AAC.1